VLAEHVRALLLLYGIAFAIFGAVQLDGDIHQAGNGLNGERQTEMRLSQDMLSRHGPPLTGFFGIWGDVGTPYHPLALDDDRGAFIYVPLIGHLLGTSDLDLILKWFFILFFVPIVLLYPLLLYELTRSLTVALASPPILLSHTGFFRDTGIFWVPAWANLLLLPLLLLIAKRWKPSYLWLLVGLTIVASFASSMRANAGLGFLLGALLLVCLRMPRWRLRVTAMSLLIVTYLSISTFAMHAVQVQRDDVVGHDFTSAYPTGHPFWHNAYMGLGYVKNQYGIQPSDDAAFDAAAKQDPGASFPSKRYESALRTVYLHIFERHPGFVLHGYVVKFGIVLLRAADWFPGVVVCVPLVLFFGRRRRERLSQCALLAGAGIIGAVTGVIVTPLAIPEIFSGFYAFLLLLWLLSLAWLARPLELKAWQLACRLTERLLAGPAYRALPLTNRWALKAHLGILLRRMQSRGVGGIRGAAPSYAGRAAATAVIVMAVFSIQPWARSADAASFYWGHETPLLREASVRGTVVERWSLRHGVPTGWRVMAAKTGQSPQGMLLQTTTTKWAYQVVPPTQVLSPGRYDLLVDGRVITGGLELGAVDQHTDTFINVKYFSAGAAYSREKRMAISFELATPTRVQFVLANLTILPRSSNWLLRSVVLLREPGGCQLRTPDAWFTPRPGDSAP
jgi:hypothetical protein